MEKLLLLASIIYLLSSASIEPVDVSTRDFDPSAEVYRTITAQQNYRKVEAHNRDPKATFKMKAYPQFVPYLP